MLSMPGGVFCGQSGFDVLHFVQLVTSARYPPTPLCFVPKVHSGSGTNKRCKECKPVTSNGKAIYCPNGSTMQSPCPGGKYCQGHDSSLEPLECPPGFYCPPGTIEPIPCPNGFFCDRSSSKPSPCPRGSVGIDSSILNSKHRDASKHVDSMRQKITQVFEQP